MKAVILVANDVQDEEFFYPYYRLQEVFDKKEIVVVSSGSYAIKGKYGIKIPVDLTSEHLPMLPLPEILIIPGGWAPEIMRQDQNVLDYVRRTDATKKTIGAICHGPQVLISAGLCVGKNMTCYRGVAIDLINAGATYHEKVVIHDNIITAPHYRDNPLFMKEIMQQYYLRNGVIH